MRRKIFNNFFLKLITLAIIVMIGLIGYKAYAIHQAHSDIERTAFGEFVGPQDAPVTIVEFMDYRCSACRKLAPEVKKAIAANPDVRFIFKHYPVFGLPSVNEARLALGAGQQGKFMAMHNELLTHQDPIEDDEIDGLANKLGLNAAQLKKDMKDVPVTNQLLLNMDDSELLGIYSTPSFFVNGERFYPQHEKELHLELQEQIDKAKGKK